MPLVGEANPYYQGPLQQPATASAPPMPLVGEANPYYRGPLQELHSVNHMAAADDPPPYYDALQGLHSLAYMTAPRTLVPPLHPAKLGF